MSMSGTRLRDAMKTAAETYCTQNELRDRLKNELNTVFATLSVSSDPSSPDTYRTAICECYAKMITLEFLHNSDFWLAIANAIIQEIADYAQIASLSCNETPNDGTAHVHNVSTTAGQQGKIS